MAQVAGLACLMEALRTAPLTATSLFSSVSATLGNAGQANYAAANAALESAAEGYQAWGLGVSAEGWGPWAVAGMATQQPALLAKLRHQGVYMSMHPLLDPCIHMIVGKHCCAVNHMYMWHCGAGLVQGSIIFFI
jgi:hypothetical protein